MAHEQNRKRVKVIMPAPSRGLGVHNGVLYRLVLLASVFSCAIVVAQPYQFEFLARENDFTKREFFTFKGDSPKITNDGTVYFNGTRRFNGVFTEGIFKFQNGILHEVINTRTSMFDEFDAFSVNEHGTVAFQASSGVLQGIYTLDQGVISTVADNTGEFYFVGGTDINNLGQVTFSALFNPQGTVRSVYRGEANSQPTLIAEQGGPFLRFFGNTSINDSGVVAFRADLTNGGRGIFTGVGAVDAVTMAPKSRQLYGSSDGLSLVGQDPVISNDGRVGFWGSMGTVTGLYSGDGGPLTTHADASGPIRLFFAGPRWNNRGDVLFMAEMDHFMYGGTGLFTGPDIDADEVMQLPMELFGYRHRGFAGYDINDSRQIAVIVGLDTGRIEKFLLVSQVPIPEPSTLLLTLLACLFAWLQRRRHMCRTWILSCLMTALFYSPISGATTNFSPISLGTATDSDKNGLFDQFTPTATPATGPTQSAVFEFALAGIPGGSQIDSAMLMFTGGQTEAFVPGELRLTHGFVGDGTASFADANIVNQLASQPYQVSLPVDVTGYVDSIFGNPYVGFSLHSNIGPTDFGNSAFYETALLKIDYTPVPEPSGLFWCAWGIVAFVTRRVRA